MAIIGSSPLGLTFESTESTSLTVGKYEKSKIVGDENLYKSIFQNTAFSMYGKTSDPETGKLLSDSKNSDYHNEDVYDISTLSILEYASQYQSMLLTPSDFAYLKDVGVFPNNRLIIARRFSSPVSDDLTSITNRDVTPLSTLISWVPDGNDFIKMSFGESWEKTTDGSFKGILNDIGKDITTPGIGNIAAGGMGANPLPGFMVGLQYKVMKEMGITEGQIPGGNPNLIRDSMKRKTLDDSTAGSGLKCDFTIEMKVVYEQKFINGVDPTMVYFDIISNALSFGTSDSYFQFNGKFAEGTKTFVKNLMSGDIRKVGEAIKEFITSLINSIRNVANNIISSINSKPAGSVTDKVINIIGEISKETIGNVINKYRIRILGIINALTGSPSTPWHVTIGNPKKPMFSSGDMLVEDVDLTLGPIMSFNDLPSTVTLDIKLKNARPLGAQEIYKKFNNGGGRTYKRLNITFNEMSEGGDVTYNQYKRDGYGKTPEIEQDGVMGDQNMNTSSPQSGAIVDMPKDVPGENNSIESGNATQPSGDVQSVQEISRVDQLDEQLTKYYEWSVVVDNGDRASGVSNTEAEANNMINLFGVGAIIQERKIIEISK